MLLSFCLESIDLDMNVCWLSVFHWQSLTDDGIACAGTTSLELGPSHRRKLEHRRSWPFSLLPTTINSSISHRLYSSAVKDSAPTPRLTHIDSAGHASMVNIADKTPTKRSATATGRIYIPRVAYELITKSTSNNPNDSPEARAKAKARGKGDVLTVAQLAAIMGAKRTSDLIPLCHPLALSHISVTLVPEIHLANDEHSSNAKYSVLCTAVVSSEGKTGVEMEALTAVSVGALTVWDMLKAVAGKEMVIGDIMVTKKMGGNSGDFTRK